LVFAVVRARRSDAFDLAMTLKIQGPKRPVIHRAMKIVSWPGFAPQSRVLPAALVATWWLSGRRRAARSQLAAWGSAVLATCLKSVMGRPRPLPSSVRVVVAPLGGSSFPSGHVLTYVGVYGSLAYLLTEEIPPSIRRDAAALGLLCLVAAIGPSRVEQGHHWTTDVVASYLIGIVYVWVVAILYERGGRP
jgi:membrane-associated phospholipid phosphatase